MSAVVDVVDEGAKATAGGFGAKAQENFEFGPYETLKSFNLTRFLNGKRQRFHDGLETCNYTPNAATSSPLFLYVTYDYRMRYTYGSHTQHDFDTLRKK